MIDKMIWVAQQDERDASASYHSELLHLANLASITARHDMYGDKPWQESLGEIQLSLYEAHERGRRLEKARERQDRLEREQAQSHDVAAE